MFPPVNALQEESVDYSTSSSAINAALGGTDALGIRVSLSVAEPNIVPVESDLLVTGDLGERTLLPYFLLLFAAAEFTGTFFRAAEALAFFGGSG
jgi:hypothetical protein